MPRTITTEDFIKKAKAVHGDKYDYSLVEYKNSRIKVKIICPIHGIFEQAPGNHLLGAGCPDCSGRKRSTTEEFIQRARAIHGDKYDYSLVDYKNNKTKIFKRNQILYCIIIIEDFYYDDRSLSSYCIS